MDKDKVNNLKQKLENTDVFIITGDTAVGKTYYAKHLKDTLTSLHEARKTTNKVRCLVRKIEKFESVADVTYIPSVKSPIIVDCQPHQLDSIVAEIEKVELSYAVKDLNLSSRFDINHEIDLFNAIIEGNYNNEPFLKSDLKNGDIVQLRNKEFFYIVDKVLVNDLDHMKLSSYTEDLCCTSYSSVISSKDFDIVKVFSQEDRSLNYMRKIKYYKMQGGQSWTWIREGHTD